MPYAVRAALIAALALAAPSSLGCSLSRSGYAVSRALDGGTQGIDAAPPDDAYVDVTSDAGSLDADGSDAFDAGRPDTGLPDAGGSDAGSPDAGSDGGPPDAGPGDAGPADAGPADSGSAERERCETTYGERMGREICEERDTECEVYVRHMPMSGTCGDACEAEGGECLRAYEEASDSARCDRGPEHSCDTVRRDHVCVCTRLP